MPGACLGAVLSAGLGGPCFSGVAVQVFRLDRAAEDVDRLYATGLFEFVNVLPRASGTDTDQASCQRSG